jgi:hypothetical protein
MSWDVLIPLALIILAVFAMVVLSRRGFRT